MDKLFHISDILTITTGRLVSSRHMEGVYEILNWMTGENLYTHQLPSARQKAAPVLLAKYPQLADAQDKADCVNPANLNGFLESMVKQYGETLPVPRMVSIN